MVGARYGGIALGAVAGIGLIIFVFVLGAPPGGPPAAVLGMIIAVITALAALQAAGVRPERPMSISVIAAQHGLIASPISAVTVAVLGLLTPLITG